MEICEKSGNLSCLWWNKQLMDTWNLTRSQNTCTQYIHTHTVRWIRSPIEKQHLFQQREMILCHVSSIQHLKCLCSIKYVSLSISPLYTLSSIYSLSLTLSLSLLFPPTPSVFVQCCSMCRDRVNADTNTCSLKVTQTLSHTLYTDTHTHKTLLPSPAGLWRCVFLALRHAYRTVAAATSQSSASPTQYPLIV